VDANEELADLARAGSWRVGRRWKIWWVKHTEGEITSLRCLDDKILILTGVCLVPYKFFVPQT
jgi:hypothetical protein